MYINIHATWKGKNLKGYNKGNLKKTRRRNRLLIGMIIKKINTNTEINILMSINTIMIIIKMREFLMKIIKMI